MIFKRPDAIVEMDTQSVLDDLLGAARKPDVMLVDMSQLMIACISKTFKPTDQIDLGMVRHLILDTLRANVVKFRKDYPEVVLAFDSAKGGLGYWRRDISYYYKKNRKKARDESGFDWEKIFGYIEQVIAEIRLQMPFKSIRVDRVEADDIIAVLVKRLSFEGRKTLILSGDGDYAQLHKFAGVKQYAPTKKEFVKCKVDPHMDLMVKLIKGDKGDCIASIKCRSDYYYTQLEGERAPAITQKWIAELTSVDDPRTLMTEEQKARFDENKKLVDFDCIPDTIQQQIVEAYQVAKPAGRATMYNYFMMSGLNKLMNKLQDFL